MVRCDARQSLNGIWFSPRSIANAPRTPPRASHLSTLSVVGIVGIVLYCADAFAQQDAHGLGRTTCDTKWLELRKPPSEYASYIENGMRDPETKETAERARKETKEREDKRSAASSSNFVQEVLSKDDNLSDDEAGRMIELSMNGDKSPGSGSTTA
jgi:hypothetical protein